MHSLNSSSKELRLRSLVEGKVKIHMKTTAPASDFEKVQEGWTVDAKHGAALLGIGRTKFLQLHCSGRLPLPVRFGRAVRWRKEELTEWLKAGCPTRDKWKYPATR